jgi:hypothetical protein
MAMNNLMHDRIGNRQCIKLHYMYYSRCHHHHHHPLVMASNVFHVGSTASEILNYTIDLCIVLYGCKPWSLTTGEGH